MDSMQLIAQTTTNDANIGVLYGIYGLFLIPALIGMWKVFQKAGHPGWAAIVPFYNTYILLKIVGRPTWWIVGLIIPFVSLVVSLILANDTAKSFGKDIGMTILLILLPFIAYPILGFGDAKYVGPAAQSGGNMGSGGTANPWQ